MGLYFLPIAILIRGNYKEQYQEGQIKKQNRPKPIVHLAIHHNLKCNEGRETEL